MLWVGCAMALVVRGGAEGHGMACFRTKSLLTANSDFIPTSRSVCRYGVGKQAYRSRQMLPAAS